MSKILLATLDYPPQRGGVARYLSAITKTFPDVFEVLYWQGSVPRGLALVKELWKHSKDKKEIWLSHIVPVGTAAMILHFFTGKKYTVILHGMDFDLARRSLWRSWLTWLILRMAERVITNSKALAQEVTDFCSVKPLVVYPSVSDEMLDASSHPERSEGSHSQLRLLTVARLVKRKGHDIVIEAIKKMDDIQYTIVGDGPELENLRKLIHHHKLQDVVEIHTNISDKDLAGFFRAADVFIMPTRKTEHDREGFGIVYLEAGLFELPVIAMNHPGVDEAVMNNTTGILIEKEKDLAGAITRLKIETSERKRMGKAGREFVLAGFTRESQMDKLNALI